MNTSITAETSFVVPRFIEELGEEGLSAADIAKSLGTEPKKVRQKLMNRDFVARIETQGFKVTTVTLKNINGLEYEEALLCTAAAKFFVGKYDSEFGDAYLAFLIRLESAVMRQSPRQTLPHSNAKIVLKETLEIYDLLGVPKHLAQIESVKEVHRVTGLDFSPALQLSSSQDNIKDEDVMLEPRELAAALGFKSATEVNKVLEAAGLQAKENKSWKQTNLGLSCSVRHAWKKGTKSGYNLKWNLEKVRACL